MTDNNKIYLSMAGRLAEEIGASCFFNGSVSHTGQEISTTLRCTLIIRREPVAAPDGTHERVADVVPVWWEFTTEKAGQQVENGLSWSEFRGQLMRSL